MELFLLLLAMIILLLLEGFFSGSEIALVHADKIRLHPRASQGHRDWRLVLEMLYRPDMLLTTTLVGTNISVVTLTTLGTLLMIRLFGAGGELYATLLFAPLLLVFGEVVPKSIYQQKANQIAPVVVYPLRALRTLLYPLILAFSFVARFVSRLAGARISGHKLFITRQQIRRVVEMADKVGHADVFDQVLDVLRRRGSDFRHHNRDSEVDQCTDRAEGVRRDTEEPVRAHITEERSARDEEDALVLEHVQHGDADTGDHSPDSA